MVLLFKAVKLIVYRFDCTLQYFQLAAYAFVMYHLVQCNNEFFIQLQSLSTLSAAVYYIPPALRLVSCHVAVFFHRAYAFA